MSVFRQPKSNETGASRSKARTQRSGRSHGHAGMHRRTGGLGAPKRVDERGPGVAVRACYYRQHLNVAY
ncbi:hypothetical protein OG21DRAFT_917806 [Imleria badia]|nr:hypothetical protein OG21DRAFT_917806 [Imleria badia]